MKIPDPESIAHLIAIAIRAHEEFSPRTQQSRSGWIGPSDFGFCRQKAAFTLAGVQPTDSRSMWPAAVGTAVHNLVKPAIEAQFPTWLVEKQRVTATLDVAGQSVDVTGTPDLIIPDYNLVLDEKTVDGYEKIKRYGASLNNQMQRHLYAKGAIQAGLLDPDSQVYVGNVYLDRSGVEAMPYVLIEEYDEAFTAEVEIWLEDVLYAVKYKEEASRDIAPAVCERICEFFTACWGSLPTSEPQAITDESVSQALEMYVAGREMEKRGQAMKSQAGKELIGVNGSDGKFQVRWTEIAPVDGPGYSRAGSSRIDVRAVRTPNKKAGN